MPATAFAAAWFIETAVIGGKTRFTARTGTAARGFSGAPEDMATTGFAVFRAVMLGDMTAWGEAEATTTRFAADGAAGAAIGFFSAMEVAAAARETGATGFAAGKATGATTVAGTEAAIVFLSIAGSATASDEIDAAGSNLTFAGSTGAATTNLAGIGATGMVMAAETTVRLSIAGAAGGMARGEMEAASKGFVSGNLRSRFAGKARGTSTILFSITGAIGAGGSKVGRIDAGSSGSTFGSAREAVITG